MPQILDGNATAAAIKAELKERVEALKAKGITPGLGTVLREAVQYRDYPMLQGVFLLSAVLVLLSLAAADVVNRRLDGEEEGP